MMEYTLVLDVWSPWPDKHVQCFCVITPIAKRGRQKFVTGGFTFQNFMYRGYLWSKLKTTTKTDQVMF